MNNHRHDWIAEGKDSLVFEDGAAIVTEECTHAEILDSFHSSEHDEVFYEEGPECSEERTTRYELVEVTKFGDTIIKVVEENFDAFEDMVVDATETVENAEDVKVVDFRPPDDPAPIFKVRVGEYGLIYEP